MPEVNSLIDQAKTYHMEEIKLPYKGLIQLTPIFFIGGIIFLIAGAFPDVSLGVSFIGMTLFLTGTIFYAIIYLGNVVLYNKEMNGPPSKN